LSGHAGPITFASVRDFIASTGSDGRVLPSPTGHRVVASDRNIWRVKEGSCVAIARPAQRAPDYLARARCKKRVKDRSTLNDRKSLKGISRISTVCHTFQVTALLERLK